MLCSCQFSDKRLIMSQSTFKMELCKLVHNTSVKGVSRFFKADSMEIKVLWGCAVVSCLGIGFSIAYCILADYVTYSTVTRINEHAFSPEKDTVFPNIHVCNLNPPGMLEDSDLLGNETYSAYSEMVNNVTACANCSNLGNMNSLRAEMLTPNNYIRFLGIDRTRKLLHNVNDFMVECTLFLSRINCLDVAKITVELSAQYFVCWKVEFPVHMNILAVAMTLYTSNGQTSQQTYLGKNLWNMKSAGIVYGVSEPEVPNKLYIPLKTAPVGMMTTVNIHKSVRRKLSHPYGKCVESTGTGYQFEMCVDSCWESAVRRLCNCSHSGRVPEQDNLDPLENCYSLKQTLYSLYDKHMCIVKHHTSLYDDCFETCQYRCVATKYMTEATYSKWPLPSQYDSFYDQVISPSPLATKFQDVFKNSSDPNKRENQDYKRQAIDDNFEHIQFILDSRGYLEFTEVPINTIFSLIGLLGGSLNLWTGITALVFVELLETCINVIKRLLVRKDTDNKTKTDGKVDLSVQTVPVESCV